jgi:hypothetical protein
MYYLLLVYVLLIIRVCITNYSCMHYLFDFVLSLPFDKPEILNENLNLAFAFVYNFSFWEKKGLNMTIKNTDQI